MQTSLFLLFGFLFAVSLGMVIIPRILVISHKKRLYDVPDARKVHTMPVPRLGGLSFFPVILMSMFLVIGFRLYFWDMDTSSLSFNMLYEYLFLFVGMTLLYLVGVCDDLVGVGYRYKFAVQIAAAFLLVLSGNWFDSFGGLFGIYSVPVWVGVPFTVFIVVYITNAINLIDGIDGLASGLCCIALSVLSVIFFLRGQVQCLSRPRIHGGCRQPYAGLRDQLPDHPHERDERGLSDIVQPVHGDRFLYGAGSAVGRDPCGLASPA